MGMSSMMFIYLLIIIRNQRMQFISGTFISRCKFDGNNPFPSI